jgi:hypothetical protein
VSVATVFPIIIVHVGACYALDVSPTLSSRSRIRRWKWLPMRQ